MERFLMDINDIGKMVFQKRREKGWNQEELAKFAGISRNYVSQIERGEAERVSLKIINKLNNVLNINSSEFNQKSYNQDLVIPNTLNEFALTYNLKYPIIEKLVKIPRRGKEPKNVAEWKQLYDAIKEFIDEEENE
jgi:transcriptional regulator with XRE-family HTH domain